MEKLSNILGLTKALLREKAKSIKLGQQQKVLGDGETRGRGQCKTTQLGNTIQPQGSCGHGLKSSEVICMVNLCLKQKSLDFSCPVCGESWDWEQVKDQIQLSQAQSSILEAQVNRIVQELPDRYKKCPVCSCILRRPLESTGQPCPFSSCARCPRTHHFCWTCLAPWVFPDEAGAGQCSNGSCYVVGTLLSCDVVTESGSSVLGCPRFRACPECLTLLSHTGCKHTTCPECGHAFCYVCLQDTAACPQETTEYFHPFCRGQKAERQWFIT
ncbi:zinc finger protein 672-like [Clupea harengus]|uniref:Zinc finger protein 672-like n=1 Tax=Clupea harengus TaxID=7950 RepID=A0A6P3W6U5_CLUHA|nr:zinc finger protein 672-like [Clupea harengus]